MEEKLVRDRIPDILREGGIERSIHVADGEEYHVRLLDKVAEELDEFRASRDPGELADLLEARPPSAP